MDPGPARRTVCFMDSSEDDEPSEAKKARVEKGPVVRMCPPRMRVSSRAYWFKPFVTGQTPEEFFKELEANEGPLTEEDIERKEHVRRLRQRALDQLKPFRRNNSDEDKEPREVLVMHPDRVEVLQIPCKNYFTQNPTPSLQGQPNLPESLPCSNNYPGDYCASPEFIDRLDKRAKLYFSRMEEQQKLSQKEIIENGFKCMTEDAIMAFRNYIAEKDVLEGFDFKFGELLHHCFSLEEYRKVYCHYNFTAEIKEHDEEHWTSRTYFAEAKLIDGVKYYFCSPLDVADDDQCYLCKKQGMNGLKHPSGGGYNKGHAGSGLHSYMDEDGPDDECC